MRRDLPLTADCAPASPPRDPAVDPTRLAEVFKALGDPVRLQLFLAVAATDDTLCVCHLPDVGVAQPTVSHHLRRLREAGLVESERRGTWVHYRVTNDGRRFADLTGTTAAPGPSADESAGEAAGSPAGTALPASDDRA